MNIRSAILAAADMIEQNPDRFEFMEIGIPSPSCGTPGCALGWISYFAGCTRKPDQYFPYVNCLPLMEPEWTAAVQFYARMDDLTEKSRDWRYSAPLCAHTLRLYADTYHPVVDRSIPAAVKEIFDAPEASLTVRGPAPSDAVVAADAE
jgi:hypothetical protein